MDGCVAETADLDLKNLLNEWNLLHHYKYFIEQKITLNVLAILKSTHIEKLFNSLPIGDQAWFEYKLELWKQIRLINNKAYSVESINNNNNNNKIINVKESINKAKSSPFQEENVENRTTAVIVPQVSVGPPSVTRKTSDQAKQSVSQSLNSTTVATNSLPVSPSVYMPKQPGITLVQLRYNLRAILEETRGGQMVTSYYEKHKILREEHRTVLINVIARYIDSHGGGLTLAESNQLEAQIVDLFPTEKAEFYRTNRRGRIYNKVANMKRVQKKFIMSPEEQAAPAIVNSLTSAPSSPSEFIKEEEEDNDIYDDYSVSEWRSQAHTTEQYLQFWKATQKMRLKHIEDIESISQILEKWPEYKQHNAVDFINQDFRAKYPNATCFSEVFHQNKAKLEKLLYCKVSVCSAGYKYLQQYQKCSTESQNLIILWVIHQLFPPNQKVVVDEMGNKRKTRYSIQNSQTACICIRNSLASLELALQIEFKSGTPPMILIVGELAGEIDQIFVYFEGVRFPMDSVVSAAQLVCELFFLFDLDYPEEALLFYYFVQTFFLNIESEMKNTKIYTVINEINAN